MDNEGRTVLSTAAAQGDIIVYYTVIPPACCSTGGHASTTWTTRAAPCSALRPRKNESDLTTGKGIGDARPPGRAHWVSANHLDRWGGPVDQHAHDGKTALRLAALEGHFDTVRCLYERGADVDALDADRRSTLYVLALDNRLAMARFLLAHCGADVAAADNEVLFTINDLTLLA
ncbi:hypothetical protein evm_009716 [Chilo suppressalis]|nr:hypothetical protein evm_009716 [Chilo suppressalis]